MQNISRHLFSDSIKKLVSAGGFYVSTTVAIVVLIFVLYGAIAYPDNLQRSDFAASIYTAGTMAKEGKAAGLYTTSQNITVDKCAYNDYVHKLLKEMPKDLK